MKKKILMLCMGCFLVSLTAKAQWVVSDPGNLAQGGIPDAGLCSAGPRWCGSVLRPLRGSV